MTLKEIQLKLYEKLVPSGWGAKLKMFLLSDEFGQILQTLHTNSTEGKRFTPVLKDIFRMFEECPYSELKVVIVASGPYPKAEVADGLALSCGRTKKPEPALRCMFKEIEDTVYDDGYKWDKDLTRWANQGILLLNPSITCDISSGNDHLKIWEPLLKHLFDMLATYNTGIVYVYMGQKAKEWHRCTPPSNYKFFTSHPSAASYTKDGKWDSGNLFNQINKVMDQTYGETIIW